MNDENLIPFTERTESEQREIARKGGIASGKSRRRRKLLKETMNDLLDMQPTDPKDFNKLIEAGFDIHDLDNSQLIVLALFNRAKAGDVYAIKEIRNLVGEDDSNRADKTAEEKIGSYMDALKEAVKDEPE